MKFRLFYLWRTKIGSYVAYGLVAFIFISHMIFIDTIGNIFKRIIYCVKSVYSDIKYDLRSTFKYFITFTPESIRESAIKNTK